MSELIVVAFDDKFRADEVLTRLQKMEREYLIDLEDAVVVVRRDNGKVKLKQTHNLMAAGAISGGFWGMLIGLLFLHPFIGALAGAAAGATGGALSDIGINDDFIKDLGRHMDPGSSALFILVRKYTPDKVLEELSPFKGKVLRTSLSYDDEARLKEALEKKMGV